MCDYLRAKTHTSYPILLHHSIISGMAFLFIPRPDFLMASTMEKFDWSVFKAAIASYRPITEQLKMTIDAGIKDCTYIIVTLHLACGTVERASTPVAAGSPGNPPDSSFPNREHLDMLQVLRIAYQMYGEQMLLLVSCVW